LATKHKGVVPHKKDLRIFGGQKMAQNHHMSRKQKLEIARPRQ